MSAHRRGEGRKKKKKKSSLRRCYDKWSDLEQEKLLKIALKKKNKKSKFRKMTWKQIAAKYFPNKNSVSSIIQKASMLVKVGVIL